MNSQVRVYSIATQAWLDGRWSTTFFEQERCILIRLSDGRPAYFLGDIDSLLVRRRDNSGWDPVALEQHREFDAGRGCSRAYPQSEMSMQLATSIRLGAPVRIVSRRLPPRWHEGVWMRDMQCSIVVLSAGDTVPLADVSNLQALGHAGGSDTGWVVVDLPILKSRDRASGCTGT